LIEATAFGTRTIIEAFNKKGVPVNELVTCGGLPEKNMLLMQIYADVTGVELKVTASTQTPALGSAMFGAVAAGAARGGYASIFDAAKRMARLKKETFKPIPSNQKVYDKLYAEYVTLHDYFGRGSNDVMKRLKQLKKETFAH
jgi:L-ribulokinase